LYVRGKFKAALRQAERALALVPHGLDELRLQAHFACYPALVRLGKTNEADACLAQVEESAMCERDLWALARVHYHRAKQALAHAQYAAAHKSALLALRYAQETNDQIDAINSRLYLCLIHACWGRFAAARDEVDMAADTARRAGYAQGKAYALASLGDLERLQGNYAEAVIAYERAVDAADQLGDTNLRACVEVWLGLALALQGGARRASKCSLHLSQPAAARQAALRASRSASLRTWQRTCSRLKRNSAKRARRRYQIR
jgi:tetratricopeptide (TPR) repeat protein